MTSVYPIKQDLDLETIYIKDSRRSNESLQNWINYSILIKQRLGIFPVSGSIFFMVYHLMFLGSSTIEVIILFFVWISSGASIFKGFILGFMLISLIFGICLHLVAKRWPIIIEKWSKMEEVFRSAEYEKPKVNMANYMTRSTLIVVAQGVICYTLHVAERYFSTKANIELCKFPEPLSTGTYIYIKERWHFFKYIKFRSWMAPILEVQYSLGNFSWLLGHNFCVLIIIWILERFKQLHERVQLVTRTGSKQNCIEIYKHFKTLVDLVKDVDNEIGWLFFMTLVIRLIFLCYMISKLLR